MRRTILIGGLIMVVGVPLVTLWLAGGFLSAPANHAIGNLPTDLAGREVQFPSASGTNVHGWLITGKRGAGAIALMHGVRGSRLDMLGRARFLSAAGYSVLLFDFQAHGESVGQHITFGYLESREAIAAVHLLRANLPGEKIGVIGVSLGGAAAALSAPRLNADALILEMVYPKINQAVSDRLGLRCGPCRILTPLLTWQLKPRLGITAQDLQPIEHVAP